MIDINAIRVLNGNPTVFQLPVTASLDRIGLVPGTMTIASTGTSGWPVVSIEDKPGTEDDQIATLWVLLPVGGAWYAAGAERLRPAQVNGTKPEAQPQYGGLATLIGDGWFGKHDAPLRNARLTVWQLVGFCLVPGSTRFDTRITAPGRSDIVVCEWPDANGANPLREVWREGAVAVPTPVPVPPVTPPTAPPSTDWQATALQLARTVDALTERLAAAELRADARAEAYNLLETDIRISQAALVARLQAIEQRPLPTRAEINLFGRVVRVPLR